MKILCRLILVLVAIQPIVTNTCFIQSAGASIPNSSAIQLHKINPYLWNETLVWLGRDAAHKIPVIIWIERTYLTDYKANRTHFAETVLAGCEANVTTIGSCLPCIIGEVPACKIDTIAELCMVESVSLATLGGSIPEEGIREIALGDASEQVFASTTLANSDASVNAHLVWAEGLRGAGQRIAIIDTGINTTLPDGSPRPDFLFPNGTSKIVDAQDFSNDNDPRDFKDWGDNFHYGHGTWVAITAAGSGRYFCLTSEYGNVTSEGTAPDASIMNLKALNKSGRYDNSWVINAIDYAIDHGVDIINLSIGMLGPDGTDDVSKAADYAVAQGVVVVASAGNDGPSFSTINAPGCAFNVTTVGAVGANNTVSINDDAVPDWSSMGPASGGRVKPDVVAPGVQQVFLVNAASNPPLCYVLDGTSFSAPNVAGVAALIRQAHPDWDPLEVKNALIGTAQLGNAFISQSIYTRGYGEIDAFLAVVNATPVDLHLSSINQIGSTCSVFEVYHGGMRMGDMNGNGWPLTIDHNVTVARIDSETLLVPATVFLQRTNSNNITDYKVVNQTTALFGPASQISVNLSWHEGENMVEGSWNLSAYVRVDGTVSFDVNPSDNTKDSGMVEGVILSADFNGDCEVNVLDAITLAGVFGKKDGQPGWNAYTNLNQIPDQLTGLQIIDVYDAISFGNQYGFTIYGAPSSKMGTESSGNMLDSGTPAVSVDPGQSTFFRGETFNVSIKVTDVIDLAGWEFKLYWNSTVLNCTNAVIQTPIEWQGNAQNYKQALEPGYNATHGRFWAAQTANYPAPSFNGSMTIATLTFQALQPGTTSLTLADTKLGNSTAQPIDHTDTSGSVTVYYGRYMRSDTKTVNGLNAYLLNATRTTVSMSASGAETGRGVKFGIRVWKRSSGGTETEISLDGGTGTPAAVVTRSSGSGIQSATTSVSQMNLSSTDSIVVRVYAKGVAGSTWSQIAQFTTEQLGATSLLAKTWTVYYYTWASYNKLDDYTAWKFYWGNSSRDSRIQNLQYS